MGEKTGVHWCHHTFNLVWGCIEVSPGCAHCYAKTLASRYGFDVWGPAATTPRRLMSQDYWRQPLRWNKAAEAAGERRRVFCGSMCDWAEDHPATNLARLSLHTLIEATPWLDWLLLTKRPENLYRSVPNRWLTDQFPANVWLGVSAEDQKRLDDRWSDLENFAHGLRVPVLFLSCEPLLEPLDLDDALSVRDLGDNDHSYDTRPVDWVIVGGESGANRRPYSEDWARAIRDQIGQFDPPAAFFYKQGAGRKPGMYRELDGRLYEEFPNVTRA